MSLRNVLEHADASGVSLRWCRAALAAVVVSVVAPPSLAQTAKPTVNLSAPVQTFGRVSYDARSLMVDGKRLVIWSAEMHAFRLPSPDLWRDILQKLKASGFNTVAIYIDWGFHTAKKGAYDFSGIRDIDRLLTMADEEGLYVITRAGPYVNAELTRGGYPGWLVNQRARARTDDPEYLEAVDEWLTRIHPIIAKHQINGDGNGNRGNVILHQIENELALTTPAQARYMDHLYAKARADGINVPIFHNDQGRNGYWVPKGSGVDKVVDGPNDLYAFDGYPGGTCTALGKPTRSVAPPDWGFYGPGGARGGASASPNTPGFLAEFGGGWFDYWGSNGGYECNAVQRGKRFQRVFYGANLANGIYIHSVYMGYGGTSWGWLPAPVVFTSYDYGAAISEARTLRPKGEEMKQLGGLIAAVPDLAGMVPAGPVQISSENIRVYHNKSLETDARFLLVTHSPTSLLSDDRFTITADFPDGRYTLPDMRLNGFDAKWLVAGVNLGGQRLVYSTSELQSHVRRDGEDVLLFYGRSAEGGTTILRYSGAPHVTVLDGTVSHSFDKAKGDLSLSYAHGGLARVRITGGGKAPLDLLLADEATGAQFWQVGDVLVHGPALVRSAVMNGGALDLTGDTAAPTPIEVWAPRSVRKLRWNGSRVTASAGAARTLVATRPLAGPAEIRLPALTEWRMAEGTPEAMPGFDDRSWQVIDGRRNNSITPQPDGQPTFVMDAYGFHDGDVWYRGRFNGVPGAKQLVLNYGAGAIGLLQVWIDGKFVGQNELPGGMPRPQTRGGLIVDLPDADLPGEHVIAVMVRSNGHNWDLDADDFHKEARGLISASVETKGGRSFELPVAWRIQGRTGGEDIADAVRGVTNNGGQYGERMGWHLPGFNDEGWDTARLPVARSRAGTNWYRTRFDLAVPKGQDATIGIGFGDTSQPRSPGKYRVLIFVNGWNMGQFIAHVGPQRIFPIPEGILNHRGRNRLALAVTSDGAPGDALETVKLVTLHNVNGGLRVRMVPAPATPAELRR